MASEMECSSGMKADQKKMEKAATDESALRHGLLPALSDLEERMKMLQITAAEENNAGDTFAQRAEWFYQRRPLLLSLLQDLHNGYTVLLGRCDCSKQRPHNNTGCVEQEDVEESWDTSDVESTLSFQQTQEVSDVATADSDHDVSKNADEMVLQLVTTTVENDMLWSELVDKEQQCHEASKMIELLKKVVELLELEKEMALKENTRVGYKVRDLLEENRELAAEALFMKKEAVGLARCVLGMRDDHFRRVCVLQDRIYRLQMTRNDQERAHRMVPSCCFGLEKHKVMKKKKNDDEARTKAEGNKESKWFKRMKNMNLFIRCNLHSSSASPCCM